MHNSRESSRLYSKSLKGRTPCNNTIERHPPPDGSDSNSCSPVDQSEEQALNTTGSQTDLSSRSGQPAPSSPEQLATPSSAVTGAQVQDSEFRVLNRDTPMLNFPYDPAVSVFGSVEFSHSLPAPSPFPWNDFAFLDELNQTFGPLNPLTDTNAQLDLLLTSVRGTPAILDESADNVGHHLDVQGIEQELLRTPALHEVPLYEARAGPPLPHRLKTRRLDESNWGIYVAQLKATIKVVPIYKVCLFQEPFGAIYSSTNQCSRSIYRGLYFRTLSTHSFHSPSYFRR
jgi:hypothetical protein